MTPNARSSNYLKQNKYQVDTVERWISFGGKGGIRRDFCNFADLIAFNYDEVLAVNPTTNAHLQDHLKKYRTNPQLKKWLENTHRKFKIHCWAKRGPRGKRKVWTLKEVEVLLGDIII